MNFISRHLLKSLLNKPAPDRIPRSGEEALSIDCNVVYFRSLDNSWTLLCDGICPKGVTGKYWLDNKEFGRISIPFYLMGDYELDITHFYGRYDLRYGSIAQYFWEGLIPVDKAKILIGKGSQFLFNKKELVRSERIEVLKVILEKELDQGQHEISAVSLSTLLYTEKWVFHPDKSRQLRYNDLLLHSLHESGDLVKTQYGFKLCSKALVTIAQYEEDQKKHRENISQAKSMKWLTVALVVVGLIQASVSIWS
ncbi:hypothetical protein JYB87_00550 [Shewanella avicenniae]|uniref:Uncharacterized protein n=1 Tax=Shewanella avicenniae TaxID=2814294 RepID=A0ABX7QQN8_9GAMM|nr:hypothetical protein [Shewanella avicenniae]QSX33779.1 hypothetical protein JYB87_00550 [Shewanella avicenniae]